MDIIVVNKSSKVAQTDIIMMTRAVGTQIHTQVAPMWMRTPVPVYFAPSEVAIPAKSYVIGIFDNADQAGDLGWHTEGPGGRVYGRVFVDPILANGGNSLTNPLSVASVLSHEAIEGFFDPFCNAWMQHADGTLYPLEGCDAVEGDSYPITVMNQAVTVSNFLLPGWFDPANHASKFDWLGLCTSSFDVRPNGYTVEMKGGKTTTIWGETYPEWRKELKQSELSRTGRRQR